MNFRPLADRILIRRKQAEEKVTEGNIIIPERADPVANIGTVVAVGEGKRVTSTDTLTPRVAVGDKVLFAGFGANPVDVGDEVLLIIPEESVLGIWGKDK